MSAELLLDDSPITAASRFSRRTRILSIDGKRRIFTLEDSFWTCLEQMAARKSVKLSYFLGTILGKSMDDNQTARLRAAAVTWLLDEQDRHRDSVIISLRGILSAIPAPAVAMSYGHQVIAQNLPFSRLLLAEPQSGERNDARLTLKLDMPPARLIALLAADPHRAVGVPFTLQSESRKISGVMNTSAIDPVSAKPLFMCVVRCVAGEI